MQRYTRRLSDKRYAAVVLLAAAGIPLLVGSLISYSAATEACNDIGHCAMLVKVKSSDDAAQRSAGNADRPGSIEWEDRDSPFFRTHLN